MNVSGEKPILLTVCWGPDQYALMLLHSDLLVMSSEYN